MANAANQSLSRHKPEQIPTSSSTSRQPGPRARIRHTLLTLDFLDFVRYQEYSFGVLDDCKRGTFETLAGWWTLAGDTPATSLLSIQVQPSTQNLKTYLTPFSHWSTNIGKTIKGTFIILLPIIIPRRS